MNFGAMVSKDEASDILEAQAHIWKHSFSYVNSMSLNCIIELGIPDAIYKYGKPMSLSILASTLFINSEKIQSLSRLMRIVAQSGFFYAEKYIAQDGNEEEVYQLTKVGQLLLKENPLSMIPFLSKTLIEKRVKFQSSHGSTTWEFANHKQEFKEHFNEAMASDSMLIAACLFYNSDEINFGKRLFEGLNSLVDVGGGTGTMTKAIASACPQLSCICFDLPHVVAGLKNYTNVTFFGGDMFKAIPQADAVLLKCVLHNWEDKECVKILKLCKEAISNSNTGGKVIIIDIVTGHQIENHKLLEVQLFFDLQMMALTRGKERNESEWNKLFVDAGFSEYKITSKLGARSIIELYP
ncbi:hypothetical protein Nepgr_009117 [Nepenthes gracilis]|uniref:Uncharacterized protein n=1 Tax=Nepenthes gracilis TaxID=150966 RepID=A0AAD3SAV9_NEPGR|nr:hypothetical protein Nepgr_009117 [Nepenthes gracilis]